MLIAMNQNSELVSITSFSTAEIAPLRKEKWRCPSCQKPVFMKVGAYKQPHFSHYRQGACLTFSEGETAEHLAGKQLLAGWFERQNIPYKLEASLPEMQQRPDLLIFLKQPIAIEFQCSPLSASKMKERTQGYLDNGYAVIWLVGKKLTPTHKLSASQRQFIDYQEKLGFYVFSLNIEQKCIIRYSQMMITFNEHLSPKTTQTIFSMVGANQQTFQSLFTAPKSKVVREEEMTFKKIEQLHKQLSKALYYGNKKHLIIQEKLYMRHAHALQLPIEAYFPTNDSPMMQTPAYYWRYLFLLWLFKRGAGNTIHLKELKKWWQDKVNTEDIRYYQLPLIPNKPDVSLKNYLQFLQSIDLIKKEQDSQYRLTEKIQWMFTK